MIGKDEYQTPAVDGVYLGYRVTDLGQDNWDPVAGMPPERQGRKSKVVVQSLISFLVYTLDTSGSRYLHCCARSIRSWESIHHRGASI
jgi:hypothetical protein